MEQIKHAFIALPICAMLLGISCAVGPTHGGIFTSNKFAGTINPDNDVASTQTGEACMHNILTLFAVGDAGAGDAAQAAGIKRIATVDHSTLSVLSLGTVGLYARYCTIVTGE